MIKTDISYHLFVWSGLIGLIALIFFGDTKIDLGVGIGSMYCVAILYSWLVPNTKAPFFIALICTSLTILGVWFSPPIDEFSHTVGANRIISIVVIWVCTTLITIAKRSVNELDKTTQQLEETIRNQTNQLVHSQSHLQSVIESAPDPVLTVDHNGDIYSWNSSSENLFGWKTKDIIGRSMRSILPNFSFGTPLPSANGRDKQYNGRSSIAAVETVALSKDKVEFPIEITIGVWHVDDRQMRTCIVRDISNRKMVEEQLRLTNLKLEAKNRDLQEYSYTVSHDLRAPLRGIIGYSSILQEEHADQLDEEGQTILKNVVNNASRMDDMINNILALTKLDNSNPEFERLPMTEMAKKIGHDLIRDLNHPIDFEVEELPEIVGDRVMITQLWQNLISNAIKYSATQEKPKVTISCQSIDGLNTYLVSDNGVGFKMEFSDKLFHVFQRLHSNREFEGTGVGLAIVKRAIDHHKGRIWAESALNQGAKFFFQFNTQTT